MMRSDSFVSWAMNLSISKNWSCASAGSYHRELRDADTRLFSTNEWWYSWGYCGLQILLAGQPGC